MADDPKYQKDLDYRAGQGESRYLTEQEEARERLKNSVNALTEQLSLQANMQKEPIKMLGGASAVGAVLGLLAGSQIRRTKKVYVDAGSPVKQQKALMKAQQKSQGQSVGGALVATLGTLAFKAVMDKVVTPKLEEVANGLLDKAGQGQNQSTSAPSVLPARSATASAPAQPQAQPAAATYQPAAGVPAASIPAASIAAPVSTGGASSFVKPVHRGVVPLPESHVEAKAQGTPIPEAEKANPNAH